MTYTVEQLAPGSYAVLLDECAVGALVHVVEPEGLSDYWQIDLFEEAPPADQLAPFMAQSHTSHSCLADLEWLGIQKAGATAEQAR